MNHKKYISGLDTLRTIALLCVLLYHIFPKQFPGGYFGVLTFFVISGYLSARSIFRALAQGRFHLFSHYLKRILRFYPALLIVLASSIGVLTWLDPFRLAHTQEEVISILFAYHNFWQISMHGDYFANIANNSPFTHLWYLSILFQFELLAPMLCLFCTWMMKKFHQSITFLFFFIITCISFFIMPICVFLQGITVVYYATYTRIFALLAGFFLGLLHSYGKHIRIRNGNLVLILYLVITILLTLFVSGDQIQVYVWGMELYTVLSLFVIETMTKTECSILDHSVFHLISQYSYEIYLWQYPVLFLFTLKQFNQTPVHYMIILLTILILSLWLHHFIQSCRVIFNRTGL